ncbi:hypothetical protein [Pseudomonas sp. TNT3]|uniref:hypothetical protein n=1 Tax=Pseudomonas sp. TNT3 TaxID=2654097 RepID=UPI001390F4B3|nr:hypothetical protein [Pseudomonas sp. TNT3]KAI2675122.1 hypothetical protein GBC55_021340 [Pseudomonas sp. TNT3]
MLIHTRVADGEPCGEEIYRNAAPPRPAAQQSPASACLVLFHAYCHGATGRGLGASHQTGWPALVALLLQR